MIALDDEMDVNEDEDEFESRLIQIKRELKSSQKKLNKLITRNNKRSIEEQADMRNNIATVEYKVDTMTSDVNNLQSTLKKITKGLRRQFPGFNISNKSNESDDDDEDDLADPSM